MAIVKTHAKGQIIIPKTIRDKLGIKPGSSLAVKLVGDHVEIRPLPDDPIEFLTGIFVDYPGSLSAELLEERRNDDRIIDLAIAFEALFIDEKTSTSNVMGEFVGLGCSMLLGTNIVERKEIKEFLKKAFAIRNKLVHGSEVKTPIIINGKKYEMGDVASKLRKYLGASIRKLI